MLSRSAHYVPRVALAAQARRLAFRHAPQRQLSLSTRLQNDRWQGLTNILADENPPPVQVKSISDAGIQLANGLLIPGACIFLDGKVFLWDVPAKLWQGWTEDRFETFEVVVPRPEILILGTGKTVVPPPTPLRQYLNKLGIQLDVMDSWNACTTYNLLAEEGRRVAAALLPYRHGSWKS